MSTQDQLRAAYDAMLQRDGQPLPEIDEVDALTKPLTMTSPSSKAKAKPKKRHRWMWWVFPIVGILLVAGIAAGILFMQAMQVRDDLTEMKSELKVVVDQVKNGDTEGVATTAANIQSLSASANETVNNPLWGAAAAVPFVGANIEAVAETTKATDIIVREALPSVLELLKTFDLSGLSVDGGIDLQPFREVVPLLPALNETFVKAQSHLDKIDRDAILPFVEENIGQVIDMVAEATPLIEVGNKYLPTILPMLGDGGTRNYAVMFQNNAEIRSTGGNPGNAAILSITDGKVTMREDWAVVSFAALGYGGTGLPGIEPPEKAALFESDTTQYVQNYTRFPEFADTSSYVQQLWTAATGEYLDGVISLDPVMLSYMLAVAGPVDVPGYDIQVTGDNAVQVLMSDAYENYPDGLESQKFFDAAATAIFAKIMSAGWDPMAMFDVFGRGTAEQRVYMSFVNPNEQAMATAFGTDGHIYTDTATTAQVGIYLNDAAYSKLEYYLSTSMDIACDPNARTVTTSVTMTNSIPHGDLSNYTLGWRNGNFGLPRTTMMLDVLSFALPGGQIVATSPEGSDYSAMDRVGNYNGLDARSIFATVAMGETETVSFTSTVPEGVNVPLSVRYSPTVTQTPVTIQESCMAMFPGTEVPAP